MTGVDPLVGNIHACVDWRYPPEHRGAEQQAAEHLANRPGLAETDKQGAHPVSAQEDRSQGDQRMGEVCCGKSAHGLDRWALPKIR